MQELPEFINWAHFKEVMAAEASPEEADKADEALKGILSDMDQSILQVPLLAEAAVAVVEAGGQVNGASGWGQ